jgi:hypothetical protein
MMQKTVQYIVTLTVFCMIGCNSKEPAKPHIAYNPEVNNNGELIVFPNEKSSAFLKVERVDKKGVSANITAPGKVSATIIPSAEGATDNIILFENPDLASNYTLLIQHQINIRQIEHINIKQKQIELERIKDLQQHGAATGKDLLDAQTALSMEQTNLANERAALIEHETKLKAGGFNPEALRKAGAGTAYITCDIPESQVSKIKEGGECIIQFTSFPNEDYKGKIDDIADVVDNATRMIKLRINLKNPNNKLKAGMFALISFNIDEGNVMSVKRTALITVQGKNYIFVKKDERSFERREVSIGPQIGNNILVYSGISPGEDIVVHGAIQLKGLSFGY